MLYFIIISVLLLLILHFVNDSVTNTVGFDAGHNFSSLVWTLSALSLEASSCVSTRPHYFRVWIRTNPHVVGDLTLGKRGMEKE
jgi:hypothetical protein